MQTILITGGAGFIGSHIVDAFQKQGFKIIIVDNLSAGTLDNISQNTNIKFYQLSIEKDDLEPIFENEHPDYVIHLAAQTSVAYSVANPYEDANFNIMGSINLLKLCKKYKIKKFITASSAAVYGMPEYLPIDENHPTEPISQYGLSKLTMEKYIKLSGVPYIIFRFSNAYGPRQKSSKESGVIAIFNEAMANNKQVRIYGDGSQLRDFVYVKDIAQICLKAVHSNIVNEVLNFSTNKGESLNELYKLMRPNYNYIKEVEYLPEREGEIKDSILSNKKAIALLGEVEFTGLAEGLKTLS